MSLSLVDYGSSSDSEDDDQQHQQSSQQYTTTKTGSSLNELLPPPKSNKTNTATKKSIFYLPTATKDDKDDEEEKPSKRLKRGTASSSLTDLLPAPKNNLNPFRKAPVKTTVAPTPAPASTMTVSRSEDRTSHTTINDSHDDNDNSENNDDQDEIDESTKTSSSGFTGSFFHIGSKLKEQPTIKSTKVTSSSVKNPINTGDQQIQQQQQLRQQQEQEHEQQQQQQQQQLPILEDPNAMYAFGADPNAYYQYYYQQQQEDTSNKETLDYDVLSQLGGKRRGENAGVNIIDVKQTDILPSDEWRRQAEAQQPKLAATSTPATFDVNSAKKKKNNIMALAAQAKSMESTLEERYAQQRVAKNQARNRYGF